MGLCAPLVIKTNTSLSEKEFHEDVKFTSEVLMSKVALTLEACSNKGLRPTTTVQSNLITN